MTPHSDELLAEIARLRTTLMFTRLRYSFLLAAVRATLSADQDGEQDPLSYLRDELAANPVLPPLHEPATDAQRSAPEGHR